MIFIPPLSTAVGVTRLVGQLREVASVTKIALSTDDSRMDVWILTDEENLEDVERIYVLAREFRETDLKTGLDVHVFPASKIDPDTLPAAEVVFER